jgi:DNA-binding Xre family transcriptional regulator
MRRSEFVKMKEKKKNKHKKKSTSFGISTKTVECKMERDRAIRVLGKSS